jgi:hypothetical protein
VNVASGLGASATRGRPEQRRDPCLRADHHGGGRCLPGRPLLDQITGPIASVTADGAYDGEPVYRAVAARQPDPPAAVIIPPRATAVASPTADITPMQRDRHPRMTHARQPICAPKLGSSAHIREAACLSGCLRPRSRHVHR